MKIIRGFSAAKLALSRPALADFSKISPSLERKLKGMFGTTDPELVVKQIIDEVRCRGDEALFDLTLKIDGIKLASLEVSRQQVAEAYQQIDIELVSALKLAAERIRSFYVKQKAIIGQGFTEPGRGQLVRSLGCVGVYAPGGTAAYPSTVLMTAIPARVAGVGSIILATSTRGVGVVPPATLVAADIAGVSRIFGIGGAQAIAALAFGTESVPRVDKICGPGNIFVTMAKKLVYGVVDIDGLQGPSEVLIVADKAANPDYCAADLLAQAEHDPLSSAILITNSLSLADEVNQQVEYQQETLPRRDIIRESLEARGKLVVVDSIDEAIELANLYAPEHLELMMTNPAGWVDKITNAGCIFVGEQSTVVLGDYVAGPSHVLPTGGTARFSSPLSLADFVKFIDVVNIDRDNLSQLCRTALTIARAEGLEAHARAVKKRLDA
ncbi:MAG: histidinol dehydrogenase [Dehalococcoidales bacterium]|nr:histidinol dehydrogenase [Dehalococcoidales bacterium]